jgi:hypothetical protein
MFSFLALREFVEVVKLAGKACNFSFVDALLGILPLIPVL